jgi:tetratricopeptide (TPR) repeat protein
MLSRPLSRMFMDHSQSNTNQLPFTAYRAEIVLRKDLDMLKSSCNALINMPRFLFGTRSLLKARAIARRVVDNGLESILFEIEFTGDSQVKNVDLDRVMMRFGTIFRLHSIDQGPDDVWYAKLTCADLDFQQVIEQLRFDVGIPLSWLTFGSYLCELDQLPVAKQYYKLLLRKLPKNHPDLSSIYNNIGLVYTMDNNEIEAIQYYDLAEECARSIGHSVINRTKDLDETLPQIDSTSLLNTSMDRSAVFAEIADIHLTDENYLLALENYEKALDSCTDQYRCRFYQKMISVVIAKKNLNY